MDSIESRRTRAATLLLDQARKELAAAVVRAKYTGTSAVTPVTLLRALGTGEISPELQDRARAAGMVAELNRASFALEDVCELVQGLGRRDLNVATSSAGGALVGINVPGVEVALQHFGQTFAAGARLLRAAGPNEQIPVVAATGSPPTWLSSETGTASAVTPTLEARSLTPKNVGMVIAASRQLTLQSPLAEPMIAETLLRTIGGAIDAAVLVGPGTGGQPTGIASTSGITTSDFSALTVAKIASARAAVENAKATVTGAFVHPTTLATLRSREVSTGGGRFLVEGHLLDHDILVYPSTNLGTGVMLLGDFRQIIVGQWGRFEVERNPYTGSTWQQAKIQFRLIASLDVGVAVPSAFVYGTGVS